MRIAVITILLLCGTGLALATAARDAAPSTQTSAVHRTAHLLQHERPAPTRPPQFVVVGFDGSGGLEMWRYWLAVARKTHAHFTFFVSGVYLLDWANHLAYHPPRHAPGTSSIGFAEPTGDLTVTKTLTGIRAGYRAGQEIGTHFNGHFCSPDPGGVASWSAADWQSELEQFNGLLFGKGGRVPFGPSAIVGSRSPCLEGRPSVLYPVLARLGFRYDTSQTALAGTWPKRELGIWSFPLHEIPFVGHTFRVVSMDYNFYANQVNESPAQSESETYRTLWKAFRSSYLGNRAPFTIGQHFEQWKDAAYDKAVARFLIRACRLPEVRCADYRELATFLDSVPAARLQRYLDGRFPRYGQARVITKRP